MPAMDLNKKMTVATVIFSMGVSGFQLRLCKLPDDGGGRVSAETKGITHGKVHRSWLCLAEGKIESIFIPRIDIG